MAAPHPDIETLQAPGAASLENPLYYLENADTLVRWTLDRHGDLLREDERSRLDHFLALPDSARALVVRLVMRTHNIFRTDTLHYPELATPLPAMLALLARDCWVEPDPALSLDELFGLYRKDELLAAFAEDLRAEGTPRAARKDVMAQVLRVRYGEECRPASAWLQRPSTEVVGFCEMALFERLRLMFFGNLRQSWSEFVITELGHQRYEPVALTRDSRAFQNREEVDAYLALHQHAQALEETEDLPALWDAVPREPFANPWLDHRRRRLIFRLGHRAEREGDLPLALEAYRCAWNEDARIRYFRVLERQGGADALLHELVESHHRSETENEQLLLSRVLRRLDKSHPLARTPRRRPSWSTERLTLRRNGELPVEVQALHHFSRRESPCYYVENGLFNSLLGLLLWPALFTPVPGAFFHPFQAGPADLYREDFVPRRRALIDARLATLVDGSYRQQIRQVWRSRQGISCPLVHWHLLDGELLELALTCIDPAHLAAIFRRLLGDLRRHRSGFPDLVRFWPQEIRYELVEIKGPGDRLQDHQTLWLHYFADHGIPGRVCHLDWQAAT